jgi:hypothetical protein
VSNSRNRQANKRRLGRLKITQIKGSSHPAQQRSNVILRYAPILAFAPFKLFVVDSSANSLKRMGKTERICPQIFVDLSFNQDMAMRTLRACQDTQSNEAWPEPRPLVRVSLLCTMNGVVSRLRQRWLSSGGLTLISTRDRKARSWRRSA